MKKDLPPGPGDWTKNERGEWIPCIPKGFYRNDNGDLVPTPTEESINEKRARAKAAQEYEARKRGGGGRER